MKRTRSQNPAKTGQALIEVAVFGGFFILILAALLSYGLRYHFQQQAQQTAFRRAIRLASDPDRKGDSYMMMSNKHIPNPQDLFGVGSLTPSMASASVTIDNRLDAEPSDIDSLPGTVMDLQMSNVGGEAQWNRIALKGAGFREEDISASSEDGLRDTLAKYRFIFNGVYQVAEYSDTSGRYRIVDACIGNLVDMQACRMQIRMINDSGYCTQRCVDVGMERCSEICSQPIQVPAYANSGYLTSMFSFTTEEDKQTMGLYVPSNQTIQSTADETLSRIETPAGIVNEGTKTWSQVPTPYQFHYQDNLDGAGFERSPGAVNVRTDTYTGDFSGTIDETWTTVK
jgi:hypothetical protein